MNITVVDGNGFTFSLSCVPHKIRSKVKSHFRLIIHYYDLVEGHYFFIRAFAS